MVIGRKHPETNKERDQACPAGFIASSWTRKETDGVCPDAEEREEKRVKGSFNALKDPFSPGEGKGHKYWREGEGLVGCRPWAQ